MFRKALIVVDVQRDFCEGGSLAVQGGAVTAAAIDEFIHHKEPNYTTIVGTKDWHIDPGSHFSETPDYVDSWPVHCVADTDGAKYHTNLKWSMDKIFFKGMYAASYSGFEGKSISGISLTDYLKRQGVREIDVVGIAFDHCVRATALDGVKNGFKTNVLYNLTASVNPDNDVANIGHLGDAGVSVVKV